MFSLLSAPDYEIGTNQIPDVAQEQGWNSTGLVFPVTELSVIGLQTNSAQLGWFSLCPYAEIVCLFTLMHRDLLTDRKLRADFDHGVSPRSSS